MGRLTELLKETGGQAGIVVGMGQFRDEYLKGRPDGVLTGVSKRVDVYSELGYVVKWPKDPHATADRRALLLECVAMQSVKIGVPKILRVGTDGEGNVQAVAQEFVRGQMWNQLGSADRQKLKPQLATIVDGLHGRGRFVTDLKNDAVIVTDRGPIIIDLGQPYIHLSEFSADWLLADCQPSVDRLTQTLGLWDFLSDFKTGRWGIDSGVKAILGESEARRLFARRAENLYEDDLGKHLDSGVLARMARGVSDTARFDQLNRARDLYVEDALVEYFRDREIKMPEDIKYAKGLATKLERYGTVDGQVGDVARELEALGSGDIRDVKEFCRRVAGVRGGLDKLGAKAGNRRGTQRLPTDLLSDVNGNLARLNERMSALSKLFMECGYDRQISDPFSGVASRSSLCRGLDSWYKGVENAAMLGKLQRLDSRRTDVEEYLANYAKIRSELTSFVTGWLEYFRKIDEAQVNTCCT